MSSNLHIAAQKGLKDKCLQYLRQNQDPNLKDEKGYTPLLLAAQNGHTDVFKLISLKVKDGNPNPENDEGCTPLHLASQNAHLEICKIIAEKIQDVNPKMDGGVAPLYMAARNGHMEICKFLIQKSKGDFCQNPAKKQLSIRFFERLQ